MSVLRSKHPFALGSLAVLAGSALWLGWVRSNQACVMRDGIPSSEYQQHADEYQGAVLWVSVESNGRRGWRGSGVRLNEWYGLTCAHLFDEFGVQYTNARVGMGPNFMTNRGVTRNIRNVLIHPSYNGFDALYTPDLAIIKFDKPLPGPNLKIGTLVPRQDLSTSVGFGRSGFPATAFTLVDGNRRAYDSTGNFQQRSPNSMHWVSDLFANGFYASDPHLHGRSMPGDSGSGGFNASGELVTILSGGTYPLDVASWGNSIAGYLDFYRDWIGTNTVVNEPRLLTKSGAGDLVLRWNGDYTLQSSPFAVGPYMDVVGVSSPHTNPATQPAQFFRLASRPEPALPAPAVATNFGTLGTAANATAYYCGHGVAGPIANGDAAMRMPAAPGDDGAVVQVPYLSSLNSTEQFTAEVWVKPSQGSSLAALVNTRFAATSGPRGGWGLFQANTALTTGAGFSLLCAVTPGDTDQIVVGVNQPIDTNYWYHVAAVFDGTNITLYVNGSSAATAALPSGQSIRANPFLPLTIGSSTEYGRWYSGDLDEAAVYTNALSAAQVQAHYQAGTNAVPVTPYQQVVLADAPAGYWRLGEPAAPLVPAPVRPTHLAFPAQPLEPRPKAAPQPRPLPPLDWELDLWELLGPPEYL